MISLPSALTNNFTFAVCRCLEVSTG